MTVLESANRAVIEGWRKGEPVELLRSREWLVTNGLGGYASGTISGECTRRYHGKLVSALASPLGRTVMLNHLQETLHASGGEAAGVGGHEISGEDASTDTSYLERFHLEHGLPVWTYRGPDFLLEKRLLMPYGQNTTVILYRLLESAGAMRLELRPSLAFRGHEDAVSAELPTDRRVARGDRRLSISMGSDTPPLTILVADAAAEFREKEKIRHLVYELEKQRGYDHEGTLWSPGTIDLTLTPGAESAVVFTTEAAGTLDTTRACEYLIDEYARRDSLLALASRNLPAHPAAAQLVLAADQFIVRPGTRSAHTARARARGEEAWSVIAGYHWFTDWGRDTMISLEGLTLSTGREREAGAVLRTFGEYIRDGLIPNMFPEGKNDGLYHTADATLWFFHALDRYYRRTEDRKTFAVLLPKMEEIIERHLAGTRFGIGVDPEDGLLRQGEEGYQLTWMDAKVDGWVVTPRRGKAVELNALFYNALRILQSWLDEEGREEDAARIGEIAERARESFNRRFWYEDGGYLYDVIDGEDGTHDTALRPNQIFAVSLDHPVLDRSRWQRVVAVVQDHLLTPVGLRSLAPGHPDYKPNYHGDLRTRDAAYHQGTVWGWLIGPFFEAYVRVHPDRKAEAIQLLDGLIEHLSAACIGSGSEIFDAEAPFTARGCVAQAWTVAEMLRCIESASR